MEFDPPPYLSPSSIGTFKQCPLKFKFNKIDMIKDDPTQATLMGNFVHDVLETLYGLEPENRTLESAKSISSDLWSNSWSEKVEEWVHGEAELRLFRWNSWWCIENLWKIEDPQTIKPSGLEQELNGEIGGVRIKGFIDRFSEIENGFIISDYKTGKTPNKRWSENKFFQLLVYAYLLEPLGYGKATELELLYLKDAVRLHHVIAEEDFISLEKEIITTKENIDERCEKGEFEPVKSVLCGWCSYKQICPAWVQ